MCDIYIRIATGVESIHSLFIMVGKIVNIPHKAYTSKLVKVLEGVGLENMTIDEVKVSLGAIKGEFDSLYYPTTGRSISGGLSLLSDRRKS